MNGVGRWTISSEDYLKAAVNNIEKVIKDKPQGKLKKMETPMVGNYLPELDGTAKLDSDGITLYQKMIGMLR